MWTLENWITAEISMQDTDMCFKPDQRADKKVKNVFKMYQTKTHKGSEFLNRHIFTHKTWVNWKPHHIHVEYTDPSLPSYFWLLSSF
jgi:hypothetical protein